MSTDQYQEVLTVIVVGVTVFFALVGTIVITMLYYQKKKFQHIDEKRTMAENYQKQLLQSRLEMQEETFSNISREIHDNVGQLLSLAKVQLNIAQLHDKTDMALLDDIKANVGQAMTDLRDIAKSLNSERLQQIPLSQAVEQELQRIGRNGVILCTSNIKGNENPLPEQHKIIVFRIIQECLQNILKHSGADQICIDFDFSNDALQISIRDNGIGFEVQKASQVGLGINNITHRASLIGGKAEIESAVGKGTTITLTIPYV
jgi:signal transduction histidine kinase